MKIDQYFLIEQSVETANCNRAIVHFLPKLKHSQCGNEYYFIMGCVTSGVLWEALKCIETYGTKIFTLHGSPNHTIYSSENVLL